MIPLSQQLFGKDLNLLTSTDLENFFSTEQEETALLEFKSGDVSLEQVYREVAAFANTEGGILIIGAPVEKQVQRGGQDIKVCHGGLTSSAFKGRDWLLQKIASHVITLPVGIRIQEINSAGGSQFVVEVPQSMAPPHQVTEQGVYYVRLDRHARPAPHAFVKALFDKRRVPTLAAQLKLVPFDTGKCNLEATVLNKSRIPADKVSMLVTVHHVDGVESKLEFAWDNLQGVKKWYASIESDMVLVNPLGMTLKITVNHRHTPFFVSIGFWSIDCDYNQSWWIYSPVDYEFIDKGDIETMDESLERFREQVKSTIEK